MLYLNELDTLNLPKWKYAIFGSGPLAIRGIRENQDLDIIVKQEVWDTLVNLYPDSLHSTRICLQIENIEIYRDWLDLSHKINEMIDNAELIENFPYVQLKYVLESKAQRGKEKDLKDIELIKKYIKDNK